MKLNRSLSLVACFGIAIAHAAESPLPDLAGVRWLPPKARLGQRLFFDTDLSQPAGQACSSCHDPSRAFTDRDESRPTSKGVIPGRFCKRNAPTTMYAAFSPVFHYDAQEGLFVGGQFLDGRAANLEQQAGAPFLNPLEMANPDPASVIGKVRQARYAPLFEQVYGEGALDRTDKAYEHLVDAIAAFENSRIFNRFSSKYDVYLAGRIRLSPSEGRGLALYEDPLKGNCAACHPSRPSEDGTPPLFTDFTYDNLGVPRNPANPFYGLPGEFNPDGRRFVDSGLADFVGKASERGKFKVPTLRNIALTSPYMHNGYFASLRGVVRFYNDRDVRPACASAWTPERKALQQACWPVPEMPANVNRDELGKLGLSDGEVDDIVAFLRTLTDGYQVPPAVGN